MAKEAKKQQQKPPPPREEIRKRAEEIFKERTAANKPGDAFKDWLQAEKAWLENFEEEQKKKFNL